MDLEVHQPSLEAEPDAAAADTEEPILRRRRTFSIAKVGVEFQSELGEAFFLRLPTTFHCFESPKCGADLELTVGSRRVLRPQSGSLVYDPGHHWRLRQNGGRLFFELYQNEPPRILMIATRESPFRYEIVFDEASCRWLWGSAESGQEPCPLPILHPMGQLLFLSALAHRGGFLVHACGAVIDGKAFVFAGHSGDGKTTLANMLAGDGVEILSDERIAIRKVDGTFMAYGTPWPGEGNVVSPAGYPLGGVSLLRKANRHRLRNGNPSVLTAEFLSRSIVPYYLPDEATCISDLVFETVTAVPLGELEFTPTSSVLPVLSRIKR